MKVLLICIFLALTAGSIQGQSYLALIDSSYVYADRGELLAAEVSLREALRKEPGNPNNYALLTNLGTILRREGKKQEALEAYTAALGRFPNSKVILSNRASLYLDMGEPDKAIADYSILLISHPDDQEALYSRGLVYIQKKNFLAAGQDFDQMLKLNPTSFYGRLGHAVLDKMEGNYDESERIYNYLIDKMPREWQLYESRADLYFRMGKNARAMADVDKLFAETTPDAALYVLRGKIKIALYERESAAKDFQKAKEMGYDPIAIEELMKLTWKKDL
ncbi:MAG: tetratricopeptide repeat protein [Tannerella sp.]|jgi:tetratricopeptide (TPR) repeat protein|nr:tetratricopeptide repeat protein [Tannerella sp.]